ncbi:MAG: FtsX-like permease family protein [bacterium]|nr:FtsX-like permease family protein [bacterium]
MSPATLLRQMRRESRGGRARLVFFVACLAAGVAAVTAVAGFSRSLDRGIRAEARTLLAADLAVRGRHPVPAAVLDAVDRIPGAERTGVREMLTIVAAPEKAAGDEPGRSLLVELKSIDGVYPFYGELELEPAGSLGALLDEHSTVVAPEVLSRLGIEAGGELRIGGESFRVAGVVEREPDRITGALSMGPRIFVSAEGLERAGLERLGSRVVHRALVRLPAEREGDLDEIAGELQALLAGDGRHRLETFSQAQPALRKSLGRMGSYLALAALLSLLIGGLGVAQTVRSWLAGRMDAIAVLKCLGYRPREILWLYLGQTAVLALLGSLAGVLAGVALQVVAGRILAGALPVEHLQLFQPWAWSRGLALGVGVALLSSLPPLASARRVPPIRVLRRDSEPLPPSRPALASAVLALLAALVILASWQAGSWLSGLLFTGGLVVAALVLAAAAAGLARLASRPRGATRLWLRQGLAALERPGASTTGAIVALGLGVLVLLGMFLVERGLSAELAKELPRDAPTAFLIDIQTDQWPGVEALLAEQGATRIQSVPLVMARIAAIDGRTARELRDEIESGEEEREAWVLRRELRLTYLDELPEDNRIIDSASGAAAGPWMDPGQTEISIEEEFAAELGVGVGSVLTLDVQGVDLDLTVTSLRQVDWGTFGINFYMVVEPEALLDAPQSRLAAARLPAGHEQHLQDTLAAAHPNVTMIRTREVLTRVGTMLRQLALGVRLLGALTVLAGVAILAGAVSAGSIRRGTEVALLKTLGMTRRQVIATFATEYALVGLVAGVIGTAGGSILAYFVLTRGMEVSWRTEPFWLIGSVVVSVLLAVAAGLAASAGALRKRPVEALRSAVG